MSVAMGMRWYPGMSTMAATVAGPLNVKLLFSVRGHSAICTNPVACVGGMGHMSRIPCATGLTKRQLVVIAVSFEESVPAKFAAHDTVPTPSVVGTRTYLGKGRYPEATRETPPADVESPHDAWSRTWNGKLGAVLSSGTLAPIALAANGLKFA